MQIIIAPPLLPFYPFLYCINETKIFQLLIWTVFPYHKLFHSEHLYAKATFYKTCFYYFVVSMILFESDKNLINVKNEIKEIRRKEL